jgi:glycosyltransferase involved in cell wall biosynthesis
MLKVSDVNKVPLVSVVIPTYNRAHLISRAIDSVLSQTFKNWELIIVDDRSTDNTKSRILKCTNRDKRIKYVVNKHKKGSAGARNQGVELAKGEYIAFLDSDDEWKPWHLKCIVEQLEKNPDVDIIFGDFERFKGKIKINTSYFNDVSSYLLRYPCFKRDNLFILNKKHLFYNIIKKTLPFYLSSSIFKRSFFHSLKFREQILGADDALLILEAVLKNKTVAYLCDIQFRYYIHSHNISLCDHSFSDIDVNKVFSVYREVEKLLFFLLKHYDLGYFKKKALLNRLSEVYFWDFGYGLYLQVRDYKQADIYFRKGMKLRPLNLNYIKVYLINNVLRKILSPLKKCSY